MSIRYAKERREREGGRDKWERERCKGYREKEWKGVA